MTNDIGQKNYRKFLYFYEKKIKVHFKDVDGIFYNGLILDLSEKKLTMVIQERVRGTVPFLLECIKGNSIQEFREKGE